MTQTDMMSRSVDEAQSVVQAARAEGGAVVSTAKDEALAVASQAREELRRQAGEQAQHIGQQLQSLGGQLADLANGTGGTDSPAADILRQVGDRVSGVARQIDEGGIDRVLDQTRDLARRKPGMYLAGAFAVGIVAGRVFRNVDFQAVVEAAKPANGSETKTLSTGAAAHSPVEPGSVPPIPER